MSRPPKCLFTRIESHATTEWGDDNCWLTDMHADHSGYVTVGVHTDGVELRRKLHVVAWEAHNAEPVPDGMVVMHMCDTPGCFNPNHLRVGTQAENIQDSVAKGRHASVTRDRS